jgi:hypothetical protein
LCKLAGGGAGFMLIDTDRPRQLMEILQPYMDLVSWGRLRRLRAAYATTVEEFRKQVREVT